MATIESFGPELEIQMVRENLALAISYWTAVRKGQITPAHLPAQRDVVTTETGHVVEVFNPLRIRGQAELARCATNQVRGAFAFSAMQSHRTLESVCSGLPLSEAEPSLRSARSCMYLLDRSLRLGMLTPVWSCPPEYRRRFEVDSISFALDASAIDGQPIAWSDFGGLDKYLGLLAYCADAVERMPRVEAQALHGPALDGPIEESPQDQSAETLTVDHEDPEPEEEPVTQIAGADSVSQFITERCIVGPESRIIASGLFAAYLDWCQETQQTPMVQRSFGMRLTGLGFARRRRGRGRHWWEGLSMEGQTEGQEE